MTWRNSQEFYGAGAKFFHWLIAALIITVLTVGLIMVNSHDSPGKFLLFRWHKALGITVLVLALGRIAWRLSGDQPLTLPSHALWEKKLAGAAHFLLYYCMVAMPLSGWLMSSAKGVKVNVFGLTLPDLVRVNKPLGHYLTVFHVYTAYGLIALIGLHVAGALKHHVIDKDQTLRRMLPRGSIVAGLGIGIITLAMILRMWTASHGVAPPPSPVPVAEAPAAATLTATAATTAAGATDSGVTQWVIDPKLSRLTFEGTQNGAPFTGTFSGFDGVIAFDPANLSASHADIRISMKGAKTGNDERDKNIGDKDWFNSVKFPESEFVATSFTSSGANFYAAHGKLTLKGIAAAVDVPFMLGFSPDRKTAMANGQITLQRTNFGIGTGEWADPTAVGTAVKVTLSVVAHVREEAPE